jgi:hypothetical protein
MTQDTSGLPPGYAPHDQPTTQVARDEAGQVGGAAADAGRHVADTAKEQAGEVAEQVRREAKDLYHQARGQVTEQAKGGQQKATEALRALAAELHEMTAGEHRGPASDLAAQAAGRLDGLAGWLDNREPGDLVNEVRNFARRRPGAFLVGAALAGVLAGRLTRGVVDANRDDSGSAPAPSPRLPAAPPAGYPPAVPAYPAAPPTPMPYDQPGGALPPGGPLGQPPRPAGGVPSAEPRPYAPDVAPAGPAHALRPEGTTVGEYVDEFEHGSVPPRYDPEGPR